MIWKLSDKVWFGDKPSVVESLGQVQSIVNVAHRLRPPYWGDLQKLPWHVWYFRLGCPDRVEPSREYLMMLFSCFEVIREAGKWPLLCHCRAGGHRGPTAALAAYWWLEGRTQAALDDGMVRVLEHAPGFARPTKRRIYRDVVLEYMAEYLSRGAR